MSESSSSAKHLHNVLISLKKTATDGNETLLSIFSRMFKIESNDIAQLLELYTELIKLVKEAKQDVEKLSNIDKELYLEPFVRLENGLSRISLLHSWNSLEEYLDVSTMKSLQFCADTLTHKVSKKVVSEDDLRNLQEQINELLEQVMNFDIDESLKTFLLDRLEQIRHAILYYRLNGAKGLKDAYEKIAGAAYIFGVASKEKNFDENAKMLLSKFVHIAIQLAGIVEFANNLKGLTGFGFPLLPGK
jgi:hypothetical protein